MVCENSNTGENLAITSQLLSSGGIAPTGAFRFDFPPPAGPGAEATSGTVLRGRASGILHAWTLVDADGTPDDQSPILCSRDGTPWQNGDVQFTARRQG